MSYKEELFSRVELAGLSTKNEIRDWLAGDRKKSSYENIATQLQEPFALREEAEREDDYDKLRELKKQAQKMEVKDDKTIKLIDERMGVILKELEEIQKQREEEKSKIEITEKEILVEEKDIEMEEQVETTKIEKEAVKELQRAERIAEKVPTKEERDILLRQAQLESDRLKEERLKEIQRTSTDKRKRLNAKRQLLKIEQRKNR